MNQYSIIGAIPLGGGSCTRLRALVAFDGEEAMEDERHLLVANV